MKILPFQNNIIPLGIYALLVISTGLGTISVGGGDVWNVRLWEVLLATFMLVLFLKSCFDNKIALMISPTLLFVIGYFVAVALSGINAIDVASWLQRLALVLAMCLLFLVFSQRATLREFNLLLRILVYSGSAFALLGIVEVYIFSTAPEVYRTIHYFDAGRQFVDESSPAIKFYGAIPRARGFFTEANEFSQYLTLPLGFLLAVLFFRRQKRKWAAIYIIGVAIVLFAQLFSLSRGGLLGFVGELFGLLIIRKISGVQWRVSAKTSLSIVLMLFALVTSGSIYIGGDVMELLGTVAERVGSTGSRDDFTTDERFATTQRGFVSAGASLANALVGVGAGNLAVSYVHEATTTNQFVDVLVETGIAGLTCYVGIIISLLWLSYKFMKNNLLCSNSELFVVFGGAYLSFWGMLFGGLTYSTHALFFFWLNSGLLLAICKYGPRIAEVGLSSKSMQYQNRGK